MSRLLATGPSCSLPAAVSLPWSPIVLRTKISVKGLLEKGVEAEVEVAVDAAPGD